MRSIALITVFFLTACGFSPIYSDKNNSSSIQSNLDRVEISIIPDRSGQFLRNELIDRFYKSGYPIDPSHRLNVSNISEQIFDFDITQEAEATRQQIKLSTAIDLVNIQTNESVLKRNITAVTSNNILESEFSTLITEQSARDSALNDLARQIERQLALYFSK